MVSELPTLSVIIPVYNGADTLEQCIEAVLDCVGSGDECIVVNDGSTDGTGEIAARFSDRLQILNVAEGPRGPACARNRGAELARGEILFFVDADVVLAGGALGRVAANFARQPGLAALFGSYDASPAARGLISRYRNLLHHFVHQNGNSDASTFWAGCGAIRKNVFAQIGGFDEKRFCRASIEDIELGYRLRASGFSVLLDKNLQGTHLKRWTFCSLIRTDITCRALPWSRLILETKKLPDDLNLKMRQRASFALVAVSCLLLILGLIQPRWILGSAAGLFAVVILNRDLFAFLYRQGGAVFAASCIPLHLLYFLYSGLTYLWVWTDFHIQGLTVSMFELQIRAQGAKRRKRIT